MKRLIGTINAAFHYAMRGAACQGCARRFCGRFFSMARDFRGILQKRRNLPGTEGGNML